MTPFALDHPAVSAYLQRLDAATAHLPEDERIEIQEGIRSHLIAALAEARTDAEMHQALEALGAPEEIVALTSGSAPPAAQPVTPPPAAPGSARGALEIIAVILLLVGAFVVPLVGWVIGVVLLWISKAWTTGEKVLGTFVLPGGMAASALLILTSPFLAVETCTSSGGGATGTTTGSPELILPDPTLGEVCSGGVAPWLFAIVAGFLVVAPIVTAIYLLRAAGKRPAPTT